MNFHKMAWKAIAALLVVALMAAVIPTVLPTARVFAQGKSLYVIADIAASPTPIRAYGIQPAPSYLVYQTTSGVPQYASGAVGLAIDTDSAMLFITYESSNKIQLVDATTMVDEGSITAPNANNLAGIVVDQDNQKVYAVDRGTNHLYVYSWDAVAKTLTNDIITFPYYLPLTGVSGAHGIALDEVNDLLYVGCMVDTNNVMVFSTVGWSSVSSYTMSQRVQGIAVDVTNGFIYTGHAGWPNYGTKNLLCKLDMGTSTETTVDIRTLTTSVNDDSVVGLAVDPGTSLLYITTGNQGSQGRLYDDTDQIMVLDSNLNVLHTTGDIGNPTGLVVPGKPISYNPLDLQKTDGLADDDCVSPGQDIDYTISYDNQNLGDVTNVTITDTLPAEVDFVSASAGGTLSGNTVTWNIGTVPTGTSGSVTLTVQVKPGTPGGTTITNNSSIDCDETGPAFTDEETDTCTNQPPTADAGDDQTVEQDSLAGASVTLDGTDSSDPDNDPLTFSWSASGIVFDDPASATPTATFPLGTTTVTLVVNDGTVDSGPDTVDITVEDTTPPELDVTCVESVNPHGQNVPGKNRGKNAKGKNNVNPDGFYEISFTVEDICDADPQVFIGTEDNPLLFNITGYADGVVIKFTEDANAVPEMKKIGSANGQADAVTWHIILPSDPVISAVDSSGNMVSCITCLVPPPPM